MSLFQRVRDRIATLLPWGRKVRAASAAATMGVIVATAPVTAATVQEPHRLEVEAVTVTAPVPAETVQDARDAQPVETVLASTASSLSADATVLVPEAVAVVHSIVIQAARELKVDLAAVAEPRSIHARLAGAALTHASNDRVENGLGARAPPVLHAY